MEFQIISDVIADYGPTAALVGLGWFLWRELMKQRLEMAKLRAHLTEKIHTSQIVITNDIRAVSERVARIEGKLSEPQPHRHSEDPLPA